MNFLYKIIGDPNAKELNKMGDIVDQVNKLEELFGSLSDEQLKNKSTEFKEKIKSGNTLDEILPQAFAAIRESAKRTLKMRHYDVQILAGLTLHKGLIAEMKTGEGKTLAATLPLYLNALSGKGSHLVTVNDYLAARDATWMGKVFYALGLVVGCVQQQGASYVYDPEHEEETNKKESNHAFIEHKNLRKVERREAYAADITYGTNNEFGFDYLRDNMAQAPEQRVQRGLNYVIVDEVDSILIDEARTPLIISAPAQEATDQYHRFAKIIPKLNEGEDYNIDEKMKAATLTEGGIDKIEKELNVDNIYTEGGIKLVHHLENALRAQTLFKKDKDYVVREGEILIVDEFTGRLMHGRRYGDGLHQAIEAKENVKIQQESVTMATITFQNYFRLYDKLSGMTGTAKTEEEEFAKIYGLSVIEIPTNKEIARKDNNDKIYKDEAGKFKAIIDEIKKRTEIGQPVLVGTVSIEKNERLSYVLSQSGVKHNVLNAKNHEEEALTISQAGRIGTVTVATNMAGRGVDIVLGGDPVDIEQSKTVKRLGGLCVIGTERHESRRIDNQLRGRSGRQGDPGETQFFISMDDDLMRIFGSEKMKNIMEKLGVPDDMPIENRIISHSIESAQKKVEGHNFDARKHIVQYDDVINLHRGVIYKMRDEIFESGKNKGFLQERIKKMVTNEIETIVNFHTKADRESDWDLDEIYEVVDTMFPIPIEVRLKLEDIYNTASESKENLSGKQTLSKYLSDLSKSEYAKMVNNFKSSPAMEMTDTKETEENPLHKIEQNIILRSIDTLWVEHIDAMDHLRQGIGLRGYGQRDPLIEYKREAKQMFASLQTNIQKQVVYSIFKIGQIANTVQMPINDNSNLELKGAQKTGEGNTQFNNINSTIPQAMNNISTTNGANGEKLTAVSVSKFKRKNEGVEDAPVNTHETTEKVKRNDLCSCGSGKKFKKCGRINAPEHKK